MSKKLRELKKKTRKASRGGKSGKAFERFVNDFNACMTAGVQSPSRAMAESGGYFAEGFREAIDREEA